jgi:NDP-sugar pyrophosphorylase family protein
MPESIPYDFAYNVFPKLVEVDLPVYGHVLRAQDYLIGIGSVESISRQMRMQKRGRCT